MTALALVDRCEPVGLKGAGVVACGEIKISIRAEVHLTRMVAAFPALHRPAEQFFFRGVIELLVFDGKTADRIAIEIGQRVLQKDMSVFRELWIERESKKPALLLLEDLQLPHGLDQLRRRIEQTQLPIKFVKIDFPVRRHLHGHRAVKVGAYDLVAVAEVFGLFSR